MVRLIVEDDGNRRAFNVGEGRLTVGSAPEAKLQLTAQGVAGVHADIEVHGGKATLHAKPGVMPPHVFGKAVHGPVVLQHGVPVKLGSATLTAELEGHATRAAKPAVARAGAAPARASKGRGDKADKDAEAGPGKKARKQALPSWVYIAVGLPVVALIGWLLSSVMLDRDARSTAEASAPAYVAKARTHVKDSQYPQALKELDRIPANSDLDAGFAAEVAQLRQEIELKIQEGNEYSKNNVAGQRYFDTQIKGFVERYMAGKISSQEARVFMKRAQYFREKWPNHPELEYISRQEARFKSAVDLSQPPTFEDIQFEVDSLTWSFPKKFDEAFELVRGFQAKADGENVQKANAFLGELEAKRTAWFQDRLEQARFHFDRKEDSKSVGVLLSVVLHAGDEKMADEAAQRLTQFGGFDESWLRGYRDQFPEDFAKVSKNRVIAAWMRDHPL